jgi:hypothetical protein
MVKPLYQVMIIPYTKVLLSIRHLETAYAMKFVMIESASVNSPVIVLTRTLAMHGILTDPFTNVRGAVAVLEGTSTVELTVPPSAVKVIAIDVLEEHH